MWSQIMIDRGREVLSRMVKGGQEDARQVVADLEAHGAVLQVTGGQLKVTGKPLTPELRSRIKASKEIIISILSGTQKPQEAAQEVKVYDPPLNPKVRFKADHYGIECSLTANGITDFIVGPAHPTIGVKLQPELETEFLSAVSPPSLAETFRKIGGLKVYTLSQWTAVKTEIENAVMAADPEAYHPSRF